MLAVVEILMLKQKGSTSLIGCNNNRTPPQIWKHKITADIKEKDNEKMFKP